MPTLTPPQSYAGESVYLGIDVHKKRYVVVARVGQTVVKKWSTAAAPIALSEQLHQYFSGGELHSVYEAGFSGYTLHRILTSANIHNIVVHPAAVEVAVHNRVKTDKRDAAKLSEQLEAGRLRSIHIPSRDVEAARLVSRTRAQLVKERTRVKQQIRMKAHQYGLIGPDEQRQMSHRWVNELIAAAPNDAFRITVGAHQQVWQTLDTEIKKLEAQLAKLAQDDPCEATYRSVPGVGRISARILSHELGDLSRFDNERQLFSYTGLTPSEHSSGENTRRGHITRQGNRAVRGVLIEVAWRAINKDWLPLASLSFPHL